MFQYESNDTTLTQYNQVFVALIIWSNFAFESACALFLKKEVVTYMAKYWYNMKLKLKVDLVLLNWCNKCYYFFQ
jgi:hypothetical protein